MKVTLTDDQLSSFLREASIDGAKIEAIVAQLKCRHAAKTADEEEDKVAAAVSSAIDGYKDKLREACRDPVTDEVMQDAVIVNAPCKHTVKMTTFQEWVGKHGKNTCPSCGSLLWSTGVMPNKPLREVIEILQGNVVDVITIASRSVTPTPPESSPQPVLVIRFLDCCEWGDYVGELNDKGQRHGHGVIEREDGIRYEGGWEKDFNEGKGKLTYPNGLIHEGEFKKGLPDGHGKYILPGYYILEGTWTKGVLVGIATVRYVNGGMRFCRFVSVSPVEGICWSGSRMIVKRLRWNSSGDCEGEYVSLEEAKAITTRFGLPVPEPSTGFNISL